MGGIGQKKDYAIECGRYAVDSLINGTKYCCEYEPDFDCVDCILAGGNMNPLTGKEYKGNRYNYNKDVPRGTREDG